MVTMKYRYTTTTNWGRLYSVSPGDEVCIRNWDATKDVATVVFVNKAENLVGVFFHHDEKDLLQTMSLQWLYENARYGRHLLVSPIADSNEYY